MPPSPSAMSGPPAPVATDIVLVGGGHSHVAVLKRFGMRPVAGARLTLASRDMLTPYSGMLPGLVAGHYQPEEAHIDLRRLSRFANARVIHGPVTGIDLGARKVLAAGRPPIGFDILSLDIGSQPEIGEIEGAKEHALGVKPIDVFRKRWAEVERECLERGGRLRVAVIGGGAGGSELALSLRYRLRTLLERAGVPDGVDITLLADTGEVVESHAPAVRRRMTRLLAERGVRLLAGHPVVAVQPGRVEAVTAGAGRVAVDCDLAIAVTHASAPEWLSASGLDLDDAGFIRIRETLQSTADPCVFAAGDIASFDARPLPKSGVYAVRQGPVLAENLVRFAAGRTLRPYRPQPLTLALISSGDRKAVASWGRLALEGRWVWRVKDWIDRRWMRKYQELPQMGGGARTHPPAKTPGGGAAVKEGGARVGPDSNEDARRRGGMLDPGTPAAAPAATTATDAADAEDAAGLASAAVIALRGAAPRSRARCCTASSGASRPSPTPTCSSGFRAETTRPSFGSRPTSSSFSPSTTSAPSSTIRISSGVSRPTTA